MRRNNYREKVGTVVVKVACLPKVLTTQQDSGEAGTKRAKKENSSLE
jgi:hypothetical protein